MREERSAPTTTGVATATPAERRVVIVTGAGGRLGSALCTALAPVADVVAVHRSTPPPVASQRQRWLDPLDPGAELTDNAHPVFAVQADLAAERSVERVVELALARFGRVDSVLNAIGRPAAGSTLASAAVLDRALDAFAVNAIIPARMAVAVAREYWRHHPAENRARNRSVVHVSSYAGLDGYRQGPAVQAAAKAALNALTRHQAVEFAAIGVRVNAVAPMAFPAWVTVDSVVDAIRWLDDQAVSGRVLVVENTGRRLT